MMLSYKKLRMLTIILVYNVSLHMYMHCVMELKSSSCGYQLMHWLLQTTEALLPAEGLFIIISIIIIIIIIIIFIFIFLYINLYLDVNYTYKINTHFSSCLSCEMVAVVELNSQVLAVAGLNQQYHPPDKPLT